MSGPVSPADVDTQAPRTTTAVVEPVADAPPVEVVPARETTIGTVAVRRALPRRARRTVGAWCFVDHFGPTDVNHPMDVAPHPHTGLQTVTWLLDGELLHRDSLGTEQLITPGRLNLMTAGHGVAHSEEAPERRAPSVHGVQLWVALPEATRDGAAQFEHHEQLHSLLRHRPAHALACVRHNQAPNRRTPSLISASEPANDIRTNSLPRRVSKSTPGAIATPVSWSSRRHQSIESRVRSPMSA